MWLLTPFGFFSVVQKPADKAAGTLTIRARVRSDLENLRAAHLPGMGAIVAHAGSDYRYRATAPRGEVGLALANFAAGIDYANFKAEVAKRHGSARAAVYHDVWEVLDGLPDDPVPAQPAPAKPVPAKAVAAKPAADKGLAAAFGGVLVDAHGRVLLREPKGHFDGYVWTFPKGKPDPGETAEQAALREVAEETGHRARILAKLPGRFAGGTSATEYFVMAPSDVPGTPDDETASVHWATPDEAALLIAKTTNRTGRARDLAVLAAFKTWRAANPG